MRIPIEIPVDSLPSGKVIGPTLHSHTDSKEKVLVDQEIRLMVNGKHNEPVIRQPIKKTVVDNIEVETVLAL